MTEYPAPRMLEAPKPGYYRDDRGVFVESWNFTLPADVFVAIAGLTSFTKKGALRGLHFQRREPRALIVRCVHGEVADVVVDLRKGSPAFGQAYRHDLSFFTGALYIPRGFAHGFYANIDAAMIYECDRKYHEASSGVLHWTAVERAWSDGMYDDDGPIVSPKDAAGLPLSEIEPLDV